MLNCPNCNEYTMFRVTYCSLCRGTKLVTPQQRAAYVKNRTHNQQIESRTGRIYQSIEHRLINDIAMAFAIPKGILDDFAPSSSQYPIGSRSNRG